MNFSRFNIALSFISLLVVILCLSFDTAEAKALFERPMFCRSSWDCTESHICGGGVCIVPFAPEIAKIDRVSTI